MIAYHLTREKCEAIRNSIEHLFFWQKPYLRKGYSLRMLEEDLNVTYTYLSYIINREYGMHFNDLVNKFRVEYLLELMNEPDSDKYTLEGLAREAGFSSRSTFYRAFYKFMKCMPTDYMKQNRQHALRPFGESLHQRISA